MQRLIAQFAVFQDRPTITAETADVGDFDLKSPRFVHPHIMRQALSFPAGNKFPQFWIGADGLTGDYYDWSMAFGEKARWQRARKLKSANRSSETAASCPFQLGAIEISLEVFAVVSSALERLHLDCVVAVILGFGPRILIGVLNLIGAACDPGRVPFQIFNCRFLFGV
jgi:hypothetical protein